MFDLDQFEPMYQFKGRGLAELEARVGNVCAVIDDALESGIRPRILEIGPGFGTALLELDQAYGERVELFGINLSERDGSSHSLSINLNRIGSNASGSRRLPLIVYGDVAERIPFETGGTSRARR